MHKFVFSQIYFLKKASFFCYTNLQRNKRDRGGTIMETIDFLQVTHRLETSKKSLYQQK